MDRDSLKRLIIAVAGVVLTGVVSLLKLEGLDPALQKEAMTNIAIIVGAYLAQSGLRAAVKDHSQGKNGVPAGGVEKAVVPLLVLGLLLSAGPAAAAPVHRLTVFGDKTTTLHAPIDGETVASPFAVGTAAFLGSSWVSGSPRFSLGLDLFGELALMHLWGGELSLALGGGFLHPAGESARASGSMGFLWAPGGGAGPTRPGLIVMGSFHDGGVTVKGGVSFSHLLF